MDPEIRTAQFTQRIEPEFLTVMRRDLALHPVEFLADSLRTLVEQSLWVEQETLLGRSKMLFYSKRRRQLVQEPSVPGEP
jgi:hypothetical protein